MTTTPTGKSKTLPIALGIVAAVVVIGLLTTNDDNEPSNASSSIPTSAEVFATQPEPTIEPPAAQPVAPKADTSAATEAVVPNVVGMNHQQAQDTMQANGFFLLLEEDATGQGRQLLWDRNWEVVSQSVPGGTSAPLTTPITLFSKKIGE